MYKNKSMNIISKVSKVSVICAVLCFTAFGAYGQLLKDDFSDKNWQGRWKIFDDGTNGKPSKWGIGAEIGAPDGSFGNSINVLQGGGPSKKDGQAGSYALTLKAGSESWTDYRLSCDMYHMDNDYAGLFIRYIDELNYFRVWSKQEEVAHGGCTSYGMDKVVKGEWKVYFGVDNGPAGDGIDGPCVPKEIPNIPQKTWFNVTVEVIGDTVTMILNKKKVDSLKDPDLRSGGALGKGKVALYNSTNPTAYDNVLVENLASVEPKAKLAASWGKLKAGY